MLLLHHNSISWIFFNYVSCIMRLDVSFLSVWLVHSFSHQGHGGQGFTKPSSWTGPISFITNETAVENSLINLKHTHPCNALPLGGSLRPHGSSK